MIPVSVNLSCSGPALTTPGVGSFLGWLGAHGQWSRWPRGGWCECGSPPVSAVEAFEEVLDSLCVPQYNEDGEERVLLFLLMASGHAFRPDLVKRIRSAIRVGLSARHVPSLILETKGIPVRRRRGLSPASWQQWPEGGHPQDPRTVGPAPPQAAPAFYRVFPRCLATPSFLFPVLSFFPLFPNCI